jgi:hypothetical protein
LLIKEIFRSTIRQKKEAAVNSCKLASPKRCKNACVVAKRRRPVGARKNPRRASSRAVSRLGVKEAVDFRLADELLKGNAGEHFKCGARGPKFPLAPFCSLKYWAMALL